LPKLLTAAGLATSPSEAARKIQQGGVRVNRQKIADLKDQTFREGLNSGDLVLEAGRKAVRIVRK
jgi:tyrosyl-tRNA synthetase